MNSMEDKQVIWFLLVKCLSDLVLHWTLRINLYISLMFKTFKLSSVVMGFFFSMAELLMCWCDVPLPIYRG